MPLLEKYLYIKKSQLPGCGKGLYTKTEIPKGTRIVEYKGRIQTWDEVKHEDGHNGYLMKISKKIVINALPHIKAFARYANDASGIVRVSGLRNNAEYIVDGNRCFIEAKRTIHKREEILVAYGKDYWTLIRKIIKSAK